MIRGLWDRQVNAIIDFKLGDSDADTYMYKPMTSLLARWENIKRYKHGKHCYAQRKHFSSFVLSVDGMVVMEVLVVLSQLSRFMAEKKGRTSFASTGLVKGTHRYRRYKVLVIDDMRNSATEYLARMGTGMGSLIGDWASRLNCTPW